MPNRRSNFIVTCLFALVAMPIAICAMGGDVRAASGIGGVEIPFGYKTTEDYEAYTLGVAVPTVTNIKIHLDAGYFDSDDNFSFQEYSGGVSLALPFTIKKASSRVQWFTDHAMALQLSKGQMKHIYDPDSGGSGPVDRLAMDFTEAKLTYDFTILRGPKKTFLLRDSRISIGMSIGFVYQQRDKTSEREVELEEEQEDPTPDFTDTASGGYAALVLILGDFWD